MDSPPTRTVRIEDDRWLVALAGALSTVAASVEVARRHVARSLGQQPGPNSVPAAVDVVIGVAVGATARAIPVARGAMNAFRPVAELAVRPPLVPEQWQPITWLRARGHDGFVYRTRAAPVMQNIVPAVTAAVLDRIDITGIVVDRVDLGRIVDEVDVNAIVDRVDVDAIVAKLDLDAIVARVDIDAILRRIDLDAIVERIDLDAIVAKLDLDSIVARVDLDAVAARIDIDAILDRIDMAAIARQVIDDIDLPEIIRDSSGMVASEAVVGARMQGIRADDGVNRMVDKLLLRRGERRTQVRDDSESGDEHQR